MRQRHSPNYLRRDHACIVRSLTTMAEIRDPYVRSHSEGVAQCAAAIARELGFSPIETMALEMAALLHDLGKIGVAAEVLNKPGKLSDLEYTVVKEHVHMTIRIIEQTGLPCDIELMIAQHHERYDGRGYPAGLKGEEITLGGRILGVADAFEAMSSHRPYRPALSFVAIRTELKRCSGTQFDPAVAGALLGLLKQKGEVLLQDLKAMPLKVL